MTCDAELCPYWTGQGCICEVIDLPRGQDAPVHACPPDNGGAMPCCGKTPFEVHPWRNRITTDPELVTCTHGGATVAEDYRDEKWRDAQS